MIRKALIKTMTEARQSTAVEFSSPSAQTIRKQCRKQSPTCEPQDCKTNQYTVICRVSDAKMSLSPPPSRLPGQMQQGWCKVAVEGSKTSLLS